MGWYAYLNDDRGHEDGYWSYTHNIAKMINLALKEAEWPNPEGVTWWQLLNGQTGPDGARMLKSALDIMEKDPDRFRSMNPENGWGNFDEFVTMLREMTQHIPEWPTVWMASG